MRNKSHANLVWFQIFLNIWYNLLFVFNLTTSWYSTYSKNIWYKFDKQQTYIKQCHPWIYTDPINSWLVFLFTNLCIHLINLLCTLYSNSFFYTTEKFKIYTAISQPGVQCKFTASCINVLIYCSCHTQWLHPQPNILIVLPCVLKGDLMLKHTYMI